MKHEPWVPPPGYRRCLPGPAVRAFDSEHGMEGQTLRVSFETETRRQEPHPAILIICKDGKRR